MNRDSMLAVQSVSFMFDRSGTPLLVLDNLNFTVRRSELVCIVGPSGAGKTTLLNVLAGLLEPTSGRIEMNGSVVAGPSRERAVVFQDDAVFPWMTVAGNIEYPLKVRRVPRRDRLTEVRRLLEMVDLTKFADAWPRELSGGMRKRVDLARAYAADPDVLLMDEPLGSLDVQTKETLQVQIQQLWNQDQRPVVFVTHDLEEALFLGTRVICLSGRPARVIADIALDEPIPRNPSLKVSSEFVELRRELREMLRDGTSVASNEVI